MKKTSKVTVKERRRRKKLAETKVLDAVNAETINYAAKAEPKFKKALKEAETHARNFVIEELAPKILGIQAGVINSLEAIEELTGGESSKQIVSTVERLIKTATHIRLSNYISSKFDLTEEEFKTVYNTLVPKAPRHSILTMPGLTEVEGEDVNGKKTRNTK